MNYLAIGIKDDFIFSRPILGEEYIDGEPKGVARFLSFEAADQNGENPTNYQWDQILLIDFDTNDQVPRTHRHWIASDFEGYLGRLVKGN